MPGDRLQPGARNRGRGGAAAGGVDHPVAVAVDDERRRGDPAQLRGAVAGLDGSPPAGGRSRPAACGSRSNAVSASSRTVASSNGKPCEPMWRHIVTAAVGGLAPGSGRARAAAAAASRARAQPTRRAPVVDMIETRLRTCSGWSGRERLGDHPAHRDADEVRGPELERVDQAGGVVGHVVERVLLGVEAAAHRAGPRSGGRSRGVPRAADVAVVEADDVEALARRAARRTPAASGSSACRGR